MRTHLRTILEALKAHDNDLGLALGETHCSDGSEDMLL